MNPNGNSAPLTLDEAIQLARHLADLGHPDAAFAVLRVAADAAVMVAMSGETTRWT
jgi:hypothetical protein